MKLKKVLLRWYKSFHLNYREQFDRGENESFRPWNELTPSYAGDSKFPFIEIPIEPDVTTVVGANESGKSHLLNAINKVIKGSGVDGISPFSKTDLCHYAGIRRINVEAWPNIGLLFSVDDPMELLDVCKAAANEGLATAGSSKCFALILAPDEQHEAVLYVAPSTTPVLLDKDKLEAVRSKLPEVQYIDSKALLPSEVTLAALIQGYDSNFNSYGLKQRKSVETTAALISGLTAPTAQTLPAFTTELSKAQSGMMELRDPPPTKDSLEMLLFDQILGVSGETLKYLYSLDGADRGYVEGQIAKWNEGLHDVLNLSHFWHQDEQFKLTVNYKDGVVYFEIHDKTECIYTFNERSSGLKYFLSYYIQAKAMDMSGRSKKSIILMDEPDAALSILAQRNLLAVFESLVRPESSSLTCQLVYTTHSPYLINRNFPRRITVVKKEDAEEGTQYIERARARRYEPVRTALGIDNAPSLFLGSDNILLEGSTDQYVLTELIRAFATPENVGEFLDLNSLVIVSADGVNNVTNILEQSRWADEPIPPTAVLLDSDEAAEKEIVRITRPDKPSQRLLERNRICLVGDSVSPFGNNQSIVTMEDIVPIKLYKAAIRKYIERWHPTILGDHGNHIDTTLSSPEFGKTGLVESTKDLFKKIQPELAGDFDKMGIFQEVVTDVYEHMTRGAPSEEISSLRTNVRSICRSLTDALTIARETNARYSATRSIKRLIKDFCRLNKARVPITNVQKLIKRLEREIEPIGADGDELAALMRAYVSKLEELRIAGQVRLVDNEWAEWETKIESIQKNPLHAANIDAKSAVLKNSKQNAAKLGKAEPQPDSQASAET
ncbi:AAA family ATPase [Bremerella alba]|nr:AAA family ATPase [Bremerella alba]